MIRLDDTYSLKSDSTCWTLVRTKTAKSGKRAGETYHEDIGYYAIPEQAVERWYRELQREVDAESLKELADASQKLSRAVQAALGRVAA